MNSDMKKSSDRTQNGASQWATHYWVYITTALKRKNNVGIKKTYGKWNFGEYIIETYFRFLLNEFK